MTIPISGSDNDSYFEKQVEDEWECCVNYINWLQTTGIPFSRRETMKRYWEDRLKALALVVYKERVSWLNILEAKYPSGIDWKYYFNEVQ